MSHSGVCWLYKSCPASWKWSCFGQKREVYPAGTHSGDTVLFLLKTANTLVLHTVEGNFSIEYTLLSFPFQILIYLQVFFLFFSDILLHFYALSISYQNLSFMRIILSKGLKKLQKTTFPCWFWFCPVGYILRSKDV